jgi:hypothetical protein
MSPLFHNVREVNWKRAGIVVGAVTIFWLGLAAIVPSAYHSKGMIVLAAVQSAVTFLMRSRDPKFRTRSSDKIPGGKGGHV